jgi:hypothetical protein
VDEADSRGGHRGDRTVVIVVDSTTEVVDCVEVESVGRVEVGSERWIGVVDGARARQQPHFDSGSI